MDTRATIRHPERSRRLVPAASGGRADLLEELPDLAFEKVVRAVMLDKAAKPEGFGLELVSKKVLARLRSLRLPLGFFRGGDAAAARAQATAEG